MMLQHMKQDMNNREAKSQDEKMIDVGRAVARNEPNEKTTEAR